MRSLKSVNLNGKTVLLRVDINCTVIKNKVLMSERIKEAAKTIIFLKKKKSKVIILAHQGRPESSDYTSMEQHARLLSKITKVKFIKDILGKRAEQAIKQIKPGEAILLDNIRSIKDEFEPGKNSIINFFAPLIDVYVNDAFSVCHRNQTSIVSFPNFFPSFPGLSLEKELNALKKINVKSSLYILGGAKPEDNLKLLKNQSKILTAGTFGLYCLLAKGYRLGAREEFLKKNKNFNSIIAEIKKHISKIQTPIDLGIDFHGKRKEIALNELPTKYFIPDIGTKTIQLYSKEINKAKSVFMKGPAGFYTTFPTGTNKILEAIAKSNAFSLMGGGHLSEAINRSKISKNKFSHISLSGGALISYIAGEKLPGIEALKKGKK